MKIDKPHMNTRAMSEKETTFVVLGINIIDDILLDGGYGVNIIIQQSKVRL